MFYKTIKLYPKLIEECSDLKSENGLSEKDIARAYNLVPKSFSEEQYKKALEGIISQDIICKNDKIVIYWDETQNEFKFAGALG